MRRPKSRSVSAPVRVGARCRRGTVRFRGNARCMEENVHSDDHGKAAAQMGVVAARALEQIRKDASNPKLRASDLARCLGVSSRVLRTAVRTSTGDSLRAAIHRVRIGRAKDALALGEASIKAIALECGYARESDFDHWFKRLNSCSPRDWRSRYLTTNRIEP